MADVTIRVKNLAKVRRALRAMGPGATKALSQALKRVAETAAQDARSRVPRRTGRLASSIYARSTGTRAKVGSKLVYAPVIEFSRKKGHPYIVPAVEAQRSHMTSLLERELRQIAHQNGWER